jgi:hypothetical protein
MKGFLDTPTSLRTRDGIHCAFLEPLYYGGRNGKLYCAPQGLSTDQLSSPHPIWSIVPPIGKGLRGAWIHDAGYHRILLEWSGVRWIGAQLDKQGIDTLLHDGMLDDGASEKFAETAYLGVHLGGAASFAEDTGNAMERFIVPPAPTAELLDGLGYPA